MNKNIILVIISIFFVSINISAKVFEPYKPFVQIGHESKINYAVISPDGKYVLSADINKIILWDTKTGREMESFKGLFNENFKSFLFVDNGNKFLFTNKYGHIQIYNTKTLNFEGEIKIATDQFLSNSDNSLFVILNQPWEADKKLIFYDFKNRKINMSVDIKDEIISFDMTKDGKYVLSGTNNGINLWEVATGKKIKTFKYDKRYSTTDIHISSDGKKALISTFGGDFCIDIFTGKVLKKFASDYTKAKFVDNNTIALNSYEEINFWNIKSKKYTKKIKTNLQAIDVNNKKNLILCIYDTKMELFDFKSNKRLQKFSSYAVKEYDLKLDKSGRYIQTTSNDFSSVGYLWDLTMGKKVKPKIKNLRFVQSDIESDYNYIVLKKKQKVIKKFKGHTDKVNSVYFSPDKKYIISSSRDKTIKIWDAKTLKEIHSFTYKYSMYDAVFTPDGQKILVAGISGIFLYDFKTKKQLKKFDVYTSADKEVHNDGNILKISPDGKSFAVARLSSGEIDIWDIETGKLIETLKGHINEVNSMAYSPDGKFLYSASDDRTIKIWDVKKAKEMLTMVSFSDGEWVAIRPDGYFNASKNGAKHINILTSPTTVAGIDQYYETFYRPDIVASTFTNTTDVYAKPTIKIDDVKSAPTISIVDTKTSTNKEELKVTLKITPSSGGIGQIRLYVDDVLVKTDGDRGLKRKSSQDSSILKTFTIKLNHGKHIIKVIAFNETNTMASLADTLSVFSSYKEIKRPNIYAVIIGINEYNNPAISLKYAVADAKLFAKTIKKRTKGLYNHIDINLLVTKEQTTKEYITKTLTNLQNISPNDLFIFYVASHGMIEDAKYHMITSNVGALSSRGIKREAISQNMLRDMIANIPTTKKFIILDTCNSGALGQTLEVALLTRGLTETTAMKVLSRAVGSTIISASSSSQEALEGYKGHGLLTYVLANGLNGKADSDKDGYIKTLELANFIEDTVPEIAQKEFNRAQYPYVSPLGQGLPLVKVRK